MKDPSWKTEGFVEMFNLGIEDGVQPVPEQLCREEHFTWLGRKFITVSPFYVISTFPLKHLAPSHQWSVMEQQLP